MPKNVAHIRIFVASPSDVSEERKVIDEVVHELNLIWPDQLGVSLDIIKWQTHSFPGASTDPQAVINQQLPLDYDIFLAVFWTRIGSPTPRAESGTLEEFELAYRQWQTDPQSRRLMLYFKTSPISPNEINTEQLSKLQAFKATLGDRGVLYATFDTSEGFAQLLRLNLTRQVKEIMSSTQATTTILPTSQGTPSLTSTPSIENSEDEEGFLDLIESGTAASQRANELVRHFTEEMKSMTPKMDQAAKEIMSVKPDDPARVREYKRITNRIADAMEDFVARTAPAIPILKDSLLASLDSYAHTISLLPDFGLTAENIAQVEEALAAVAELRESMKPSKASMVTLRESTARLPRATTQFNRARRKYLDVIDSYIAIHDQALNLIPQIEETATGILTTYGQSHDSDKPDERKPLA